MSSSFNQPEIRDSLSCQQQSLPANGNGHTAEPDQPPELLNGQSIIPAYKLYSRRAGELRLAPSVPEALQSWVLPGFAPLSSVHDGISILFQQYQAEHYTIRVTQISATRDDQCIVMAGPATFLIYNLYRTLDADLKGINRLQLYDHSFNLVHLPLYLAEYDLKAGSRYRFVEILLNSSYLEPYNDQFAPLQDFQQQVAIKKAARCCPVHQVADIEMIRLLHNLLQAGINNRMQADYMNDGMATLVNHSLEKLTQRAQKRTPRISPGEIQDIYTIKEFIQANIRQHYTREELSARFGLSQYRIKMSFPAVYGLSAADYAQEERIRIAKTLLEHTDLSIDQVADQAGYANRKVMDVVFLKNADCTAHAYRSKVQT